MKRNPNLREKYLDGEKLFRKYFEMGNAKTIRILAKWAISEGMARPTKITKRNPEGLPSMGVWKSMWRWASLKENMDLAWEIYSKWNPKVSVEQYTDDMIENKIPVAWQHQSEEKKTKIFKRKWMDIMPKKNDRITHYIPQNLPKLEQEFVTPVPDDYFIWWLFGYRCIVCRHPATEINEIIPRSRSKKSTLDWRNRVPLCRDDHTKYHLNGVTDDKIREMQELRRTYLISTNRGKYA